MKGSVLLGIFLIGISAFFAVSSFSYRGMAGFVPLVLAVPTLCLAALVLAGERFPRIMKAFEVSLEDVLAGPQSEDGAASAPAPDGTRGSELATIVIMFAWFAGYAVALFFVGFYIASGVFALLFTHYQGKIGWFGSLVMVTLALGFFYIVFQEALHVDLFAGALFDAQVPPL